MTLSSVKSGQSCKIVKISSSKEALKKFNRLGLVEGTNIKVVRKALFNGPIEILIRSYYLALRITDADQIIVEIQWK